MRALTFCLVLALAACGQTTAQQTPATTEAPVAAAPGTAAEATAQDTCGAAQYRAMIGVNIAAASFPANAGIRIIQPGTPVTEDFRPERLNVLTDANGVITSLECY